MSLGKVRLISGRSNMELAKLIAKDLRMSLTETVIRDFNNKEISVEIQENIRGKKVYIIVSGSSYEGRSINDHLMETFILNDACQRSGAKKVSIIIPFYPYARSDKHDAPRVPIVGAMVTTIFQHMKVNRIIAMDLHSGQIQGFGQIPFDNLYAINLFVDKISTQYFGKGNEKFVLVSPDAGAVKRNKAYAQKLGLPHVMLHKERDHSKPGTVVRSSLVGKEFLEGRDLTAIVIDDMLDTCGTIISAILELGERQGGCLNGGVRDVIVVATHGIFSGNALEKINNTNLISKVIVTNSVPQSENCKRCLKLEVVDTSMLFAEVIRRLENGSSVSELFK